MLALEVIRGVDQGRIYPLPDGEPQLVGRSSEALPLTDRSVSRRHAELTPDGHTWWLRDLRSANGPWVNGRRLDDRVALTPGDEITCGETVLRFTHTDRLIGGPAALADPSGEIPAEGTVALSNPRPQSPDAAQARLISMGETVATISHAVKNIMQGLRGGAGAIELALAKKDIEMANEAWPILSRSLDRIHDLTFNMLAWSRSASVETEPLQLGPIIKEAIDLLAVQCRHRKVTIQMEGQEDLPPVPVDASAFHQAILNLLTNAIEAIPAKTGRIRVVLQVDEPCQWVIVAVEDNGDGVEGSRQEEIFQPFTSSKGQRGTGLGLAVTRKIASEHGGTLQIDPDYSEGARFLLRLPLVRDGDPGDTDVPGSSAGTGPPIGEFDD